MDYKNLFRKIDRNLRTIERSNDLLATLAEILGGWSTISRTTSAWSADGSTTRRVELRPEAEYPTAARAEGLQDPGDVPADPSWSKGYVYAARRHRVDARSSALGVNVRGDRIGETSGRSSRSRSKTQRRGRGRHTLNTIRHAIN
jgi:hypothetical protein